MGCSRPLRRAGRSYTVGWSAENKLAQLAVGALVYKYAYSADHARVMKTVPGSGGSTLTTRYLGPEPRSSIFAAHTA